MAREDYRTVKSMGFIIKSRMDLMKQWDKKDALALMLPQRVEDGKLYNFKNDVIGGCNGEDVIFHEDDTIITETNRITDKFLNTFYAPMEAYFGSTEETKEDSEASQAAVDADENAQEDSPTGEIEDIEFDLVAEVAEFIEKDKLKKAKKLLKANPDHADFKAAKKLIKKAGK